jgi:membrane protein DedA with SNARE-associated domain
VDSLTESVVEWTTELVGAFGYPGLAVLAFLEIIVPPIPGEIVLPLMGFLSTQTDLYFAALVAVATVGAVAAALVLYAIGFWLGAQRLRVVIRRYGRWVLLYEDDVSRALEWFDRHDKSIVLVGRLIPTVRSYISIPAGVARMPLGTFIVYTAIGSGLWNLLLIGLGWLLGHQWAALREYAQWIDLAILAIGVLSLALFFWYRWRTRDKGKRPS